MHIFKVLYLDNYLQRKPKKIFLSGTIAKAKDPFRVLWETIKTYCFNGHPPNFQPPPPPRQTYNNCNSDASCHENIFDFLAAACL